MRSDCNQKKPSILLTEIFQIEPKNEELFVKALTHSSFTKEKEVSSLKNYERLEFLGDAVLKLSVSEILYKKFPSYPEGELTKIRSILVSDSTLAKVSQKIGLDKLIILGKQEEKMGGRKRTSILACVFEAVLGAFYLEGEIKAIGSFLEKILCEEIKEVDENFEKFNAKAILQEYTQAQTKETPKYRIVEATGPSHNQTFLVEVSYQNEVLASEKGKTKKQAEQNCAYSACLKLGIIKQSGD